MDLSALLTLERYPVPGTEEMLACVLTVLLSIFLHGVSANPFSNGFSKEVA